MLRHATLAFVLVAVAVILLWGFLAAPSADAPLPPVAQYYLDHSVSDTGAVNVVAAINFDFRAYDTIGEASILLTAVTGVSALLRSYHQRRRETGEA